MGPECTQASAETVAVVVVPRIVQEVDAAVDAGLDQLDGFRFADVGPAEVIASEADRRDFFAGASQSSIRNAVVHSGVVHQALDVFAAETRQSD